MEGNLQSLKEMEGNLRSLREMEGIISITSSITFNGEGEGSIEVGRKNFFDRNISLAFFLPLTFSLSYSNSGIKIPLPVELLTGFQRPPG